MVHGSTHVPITGKQPVRFIQSGHGCDLTSFLTGHRCIKTQAALTVQFNGTTVVGSDPEHPAVNMFQFIVGQVRSLLAFNDFAVFIQYLENFWILL